MLRTALRLETVKGSWLLVGGGGALTGERGLVSEVGVLVLLVALDGLL